MTVNKYPEDIYPKLGFRTDGFGRLTYRTTYNSDFERAYDLGYQDGQQAQGDHPLAGWSNLTEAIADGERIDWEKLDGLEAKCVHPEMGTFTYKLERDGSFPPAKYSAWYKTDCPSIWLEALIKSWLGHGGWALYIKGELPLRKLTADGLVLGTCFRARYTKGDYVRTYSRAQAAHVDGKGRVLCFNESMTHVIARYNPAEVEVIEIYGMGTFEKPEGDA